MELWTKGLASKSGPPPPAFQQAYPGRDDGGGGKDEVAWGQLLC